MGLLDKLRGATRGVFRDVKPQSGVAPVPPEELKTRLRDISGPGVHVAEDEEGRIALVWAAKAHDLQGKLGVYHRTLRLQLDPETRTARALCLTRDLEAGPELGGFEFGGEWTRGQQFGFEDLDVVAWITPEGETPTDERYRFSWSKLRDPAVEIVTGAGWTYSPKAV